MEAGHTQQRPLSLRQRYPTLRGRAVLGLLLTVATSVPVATAAQSAPPAEIVQPTLVPAGVRGTLPAGLEPRIAEDADPGGPHAPAGLRARCAEHVVEEEGILADVSRAMARPNPADVRAALAVLEPEARVAAEATPHDIDAQYRLAVVLGARAEVEGTGSKVSASRDLYTQVLRVLELEPEHPGATHMLGRLHAGVLRLDPVARFVAIRLLGGGALRRATWQEARELMEFAEERDSCVPDYHYELGRLYADRGDAKAARRELAHVLELTEGGEGRWVRIREKAERAAALGPGERWSR